MLIGLKTAALGDIGDPSLFPTECLNQERGFCWPPLEQQKGPYALQAGSCHVFLTVL